MEWDAAQKAAFVEMPFDAQHAYYQEHYTGAAFDVILGFGQPAGRLYVAREENEIRIVDVALLPDTATAASGRHCCADCNQRRRPRASPAFALRATAGRLLRIHVERFNPALRLYERLGFHPIADRGFICSWNGGGATTPNLQLPTPKESRSKHWGERRGTT